MKKDETTKGAEGLSSFYFFLRFLQQKIKWAKMSHQVFLKKIKNTVKFE